MGENRYFARAMDNSDAWSDPARCTGTITPLTITGDLDHDGKVDLLDFSIFAAAWQTEPGDPEWNPVCDISDPPDDVIDFKDLRELVKHWLVGLGGFSSARTFVYFDDFETDRAMYESWQHSSFVEWPPP